MTRPESFSRRVEEIETALGIASTLSENRAQSSVWRLDSPGARQSVRLELISAESTEELAWASSVDDIGVWEVAVCGGGPSRFEGASGAVGRLRWTS